MWGCFLMSGVKILHSLKDWWKSIPIHQTILWFNILLSFLGIPEEYESDSTDYEEMDEFEETAKNRNSSAPE